MKYIAKSIKDTDKIASEFAQKIKKGDIVLLAGDLGAGKTTFVQHIFSHLGVKEVVNSPTFAVLKTYTANDCILHHFDTYRITTEEAIECGFDEILTDKESIIFIEWADKIKELIPAKHIAVNIKIVDNGQREFEIIGLD